MINVSFVGAGGMAAHYIDVYRSLDFVRLVNTIDPAVPAISPMRSSPVSTWP